MRPAGKPRIPVSSYADRMILRLRRLIPAAVEESDVEAIHDARVATRRLKAAFDLAAPLLADPELDDLKRTLRRLRRRLGPVRDADVMLAQTRKFAADAKHAAAARWLGERLMMSRSRALKRLHKSGSAGRWIDRLRTWPAIRAQLELMGGPLRQSIEQAAQAQMTAFTGQAGRLCSLLIDGAAEATQPPHELRISAKLLRYTLEMLADLESPPPAASRRFFKRLQDALGRWHDQVVLAERALSELAEAKLAQTDPGLSSAIMALAARAVRQGDRSLQRFARLWREHQQELMGTRSTS